MVFVVAAASITIAMTIAARAQRPAGGKSIISKFIIFNVDERKTRDVES